MQQSSRDATLEQVAARICKSRPEPCVWATTGVDGLCADCRSEALTLIEVAHAKAVDPLIAAESLPSGEHPSLLMLRQLQREAELQKISEWKRRVPFGDLITDRHQNARNYGFGDGTTMYDSVFVLGDVKVGRNCWIGPNVILDGSGGVEIGDWVCIDANTQIYSHDSSDRFVNMGQGNDPKARTKIGSGVFIGPNCVVSMGVTIGSRVKLGAGSWARSDIPSNSVAYGWPIKVTRSL